MRKALIALIAFAALPHIAYAQDADQFNAKLDITQDPICFAVKNEAAYTVIGSMDTANYMRPDDNVLASHRSNFRLKTGEQEEYCSYGPFFPNRSLRLTLRTLFPVFECYSRVDSGTITIKGQRRADDSGVITWAECYGADGTTSGKPEE
ncbi:MAG: hypothetical protein KTR28_05680 [Micavibrio sp.]|nr:hypothetical protein [Micavibrio sp.]